MLELGEKDYVVHVWEKCSKYIHHVNLKSINIFGCH